MLVNNMYDIVEINTENEYVIDIVSEDNRRQICNQGQAMEVSGEN